MSFLWTRSVHDTECFRLAKWIELDLNESATAYPPLLKLSDSLVIKVADEKYAKFFLPDYSSCRIIIAKNCHGLMDCASFKLKTLEAIHNTGTLDRTSVIVSDYDAIILGRKLINERTYSASPGHRSWSTSLMGFGKFTDIGNGVHKAKKTFMETLRDDIAFRAVRAKIPNEDIQPTFHARGKAWPTKDPVLAFIIGVLLKVSVVSLTVIASRQTRKVLKIGLLLIIGWTTTLIVHHVVRYYSTEYFVVPDDSTRIWLSLPLTGISIMIDSAVLVLRHDLYGPFLTGPGALLAALVSIFEETGLSTIAFYFYVFKRQKKGWKWVSEYFLRKLCVTQPLCNSITFLVIIGLILTTMMSTFGLSVPGGTWKHYVHCNKVKCRELTSSDMNRFFHLAWEYVYTPILNWSFVLFITSSFIRNKKTRQTIIVGSVALVGLRCQFVSKRAFPGIDLPYIERSIETKTINGSYLRFSVKIPERIENVETTKMNVGSGELVRFKTGSCLVHPNWHKVIWMNAICHEKHRPRSIIFYDDDVKLTHLRDYMKLGLHKESDATLVEDPHVPGHVVSYIGRFNLQNCSLLNQWMHGMRCGIYRTLNDQPVLNSVMVENNFSVKRVRIPVLHRDRGSKGFGIKPQTPKWTVSAISLVVVMMMDSYRFDGMEELIFHGMMIYMSGLHLEEIQLQRTSASPYEAVREIKESRRIVEAQPRLYTIFNDYSGKAAEFHFSLWVFLRSTTILFLTTNFARLLISLLTGTYIASAIDVVTTLAAESKFIIQRRQVGLWLHVHSLTPVDPRRFRLALGENKVMVGMIKRKQVQ